MSSTTAAAATTIERSARLLREAREMAVGLQPMPCSKGKQHLDPGERTGCSRCSNLQYECVYAVSRVGKVPGIRARANKQSRTNPAEKTAPTPRSESAVLQQQDADADADTQTTTITTTTATEPDEPHPTLEFGDKPNGADAGQCFDANTPKSPVGIYADWTNPSADQSPNPFDSADLFILPSQLMSSEHDPSRSSRCHSQAAGVSHIQSPAHATPFLDAGMLPLDLPDLPDMDLPDLDLHIHDFHPMDLPMCSLETPAATPATPSTKKRRSVHLDPSRSYPSRSASQYTENVSVMECDGDFSTNGRRHQQQYNYRSWTILSCNRIVEFLEHHIQRGVIALDVVMHTNKVTLAEISRLLSQGAHKERSNCAMLLLIAIEQIVTLFERSVGQDPSESDRASIISSMGGLTNIGACKSLSRGNTSGNVLPNLRFGSFQISQDEQLELRSYLLQRELQRCLQVLNTLRDSITLEPNPCIKLEERVGKLSSTI
ncbi:hypothetical protein MGYG_09013 [Nannizzia gypsea CBS 118893]|uniref:Zn(2)-C6 fungal-type domain-containing protein n=1 Tax=Arthroderma gypseum (strain ATCC MYA-4604 / CBS 118893) TaxID=535722 RepID=E4UMT3_ARTGP|nr:hypothetical protein MGYG_09013 [Nannizzia gypsea CBS 118893]EFR00287.1 hypothetical protein MGYG_09013 [Nannizzia gypsea CBS 118893]